MTQKEEGTGENKTPPEVIDLREGSQPPSGNGSSATNSVTELDREKFLHLARQQNELISAIKKVFAYLNSAIILIVIVGIWMDQVNLWGNVIPFKSADRLITTTVISSLIAATVAQAGIAFVLIVKYLFPQSPSADKNSS
jgi:hypothetical protein